jgi:hypothetical protein
MRPASVVVSAQGSARERSPASASLIRSAIAPLTFSSKIRALGLAQRRTLLGEVLPLGGDAGIADQRAGEGLLGQRSHLSQIIS